MKTDKFLYINSGYRCVDFSFINMGGHWHFILPRGRKDRPQRL